MEIKNKDLFNSSELNKTPKMEADKPLLVTKGMFKNLPEPTNQKANPCAMDRLPVEKQTEPTFLFSDAINNVPNGTAQGSLQTESVPP